MSRLLSVEMAFGLLNWVIVFQTLRLGRAFQSHSWDLLAAGFFISGCRRVIVIMEWSALDRWHVDGWLLLIALVLLVAGFDGLRRDLRRLGVKV